MKRLFFALSLFCLAACQKKMDLSNYRWSSKESKESKSEPTLEPTLFKDPESTVMIYDEIIERYKQRIGGAIVEGSFLQKISTTKGHLQFLNAQFETTPMESLKVKAERLHNLRFTALEVIKRKHLGLHNASHIFDPEIIISGSESKPKLQFQFEFIPKNGTGVYSMRVSPSFAIESIERVENCFQESRSYVFPTGPRLSELIETFLTPLIGDGSLSSPRVSVTSLDGRPANAENGEFVFSTEDSRFNQVQAFFFAQKTLSYAETNWGFNLPFPLRIEINDGYPEKSDKMYYYKRIIRLGEGKDSYRNIPRDPSIVTHEVAHAIIDAISGMSAEGEAGRLNEGFADYLTASIWEIPELGHTAYIRKPFTRTVDVKTLYSEQNGGTYHDAGILSGTLWELEKQLGGTKTQKLALKTLARLGFSPKFSDVYPALFDAAESASLTAEDFSIIKDVFSKRGWPTN